MAKQVGPLFFTGTVDGLIFYKLGDQYYMRSKGDYKSGKQMRKDSTYKRTMQNADRFGGASKLVKPIYYRYLPKAVRKHGLFGKLTGMVNRWLRAGKSQEEVRQALIAHCQNLVAAATPTAAPSIPNAAVQKVVIEKRLTAETGRTKTLRPLAQKNKQARYLSRWRVKCNGRLHIPKRQMAITSTLGDVKRE